MTKPPGDVSQMIYREETQYKLKTFLIEHQRCTQNNSRKIPTKPFSPHTSHLLVHRKENLLLVGTDVHRMPRPRFNPELHWMRAS